MDGWEEDRVPPARRRPLPPDPDRAVRDLLRRLPELDGVPLAWAGSAPDVPFADADGVAFRPLARLVADRLAGSPPCLVVARFGTGPRDAPDEFVNPRVEVSRVDRRILDRMARALVALRRFPRAFARRVGDPEAWRRRALDRLRELSSLADAKIPPGTLRADAVLEWAALAPDPRDAAAARELSAGLSPLEDAVERAGREPARRLGMLADLLLGALRACPESLGRVREHDLQAALRAGLSTRHGVELDDRQDLAATLKVAWEWTTGRQWTHEWRDALVPHLSHSFAVDGLAARWGAVSRRVDETACAIRAWSVTLTGLAARLAAWSAPGAALAAVAGWLDACREWCPPGEAGDGALRFASRSIEAALRGAAGDPARLRGLPAALAEDGPLLLGDAYERARSSATARRFPWGRDWFRCAGRAGSADSPEGGWFTLLGQAAGMPSRWRQRLLRDLWDAATGADVLRWDPDRRDAFLRWLDRLEDAGIAFEAANWHIAFWGWRPSVARGIGEAVLAAMGGRDGDRVGIHAGHVVDLLSDSPWQGDITREAWGAFLCRRADLVTRAFRGVDRPHETESLRPAWTALSAACAWERCAHADPDRTFARVLAHPPARAMLNVEVRLAACLSGGDPAAFESIMAHWPSGERDAAISGWSAIPADSRATACLVRCSARPELLCRVLGVLDRLAAIARLEPRQGVAAVLAAWADATNATFAGAVPASLGEKRRMELETLSRMEAEGSLGPDAAARLSHLRRVLGEGAGQGDRRAATRAADKRAALAGLAVLESLAAGRVRAHWAALCGAVPPEGDDRDWDNALALLADLHANRSLFRGFLRAAAAGARRVPYDHPANRDFLARLGRSGVSTDGWVGPFEHRFDPAPAGWIVRAECDPLKALQAGTAFDTCIGAGGVNSHGAVALAVEANKRVVWVLDDKGRIAGRRILAITASGRLYGFRSYGASSRPWVKVMLDVAAAAFARRIGATLGGEDAGIPDDAAVTRDPAAAFRLFAEGYLDGPEPFDAWVAAPAPEAVLAWLEDRVAGGEASGPEVRAMLFVGDAAAHLVDAVADRMPEAAGELLLHSTTVELRLAALRRCGGGLSARSDPRP